MRKIIAVDFDGTLVENKWPKIGKMKKDVVKRLYDEIFDEKAYVIIWTCRSGTQLQEMQDWLVENKVYFDRINANAPWIIDQYGRDNRKIYADEYWDDKAVLI